MRALRDKLKVQNIFHYIIIFSMLVMLIILVMGGYLYRFYYKTVYDSFCTENKSELNTVINQHENDMQIITDIMLQTEMSTDTTKFFLSEQPQKSTALKAQINLYTKVSQFFDQMFYYYQEDEYLYNHSTSANIDFFCKHLQLQHLPEEQFEELLGQKLKKMLILPEQKVDGHFVFNYMSSGAAAIYMLPLAPDYDGILLFLVGNDYYDRILHAEDRNNYIIYNGEVIAQRGSLVISKEQIISSLTEELPEEVVQKEVSYDGERYLLTAQKMENKIVYATLQPMEFFFDCMLSGQWGIVMLLLVCCIPAAFIIMLGSKRLMDWFQNMNHLLNRGEQHAYNMEHMQADVQALVKAERESVVMRKTVFVRNFIRSDYACKEVVLENAQKVGMNVDYTYYVVALVSDREIGRENKAFQQMLEVIGKDDKTEGYGVHLINSNQKLFVIFANEKESIEQMVNKMFEVGRTQCEEFVMAVSYYHEEFTNGSMAYVEAVTAYDSRYLVDNSRIIFYNDVRQPVNWEIIPTITLQNLKNALKTRNGESVKDIIQEICERMRKERPSMFTFRWIYDDILRILLAEWPGAENEWNQIYNVFTLSRCQSIEDFNELLTEACRMILESETDVQSQQTSVAENAMHYMNMHYKEADLNMSMLADYLQISSVTLAVEFKNETGVSPSDYLGSLRMEQAKKLLKETDLLIKEISLAVGYEDDHVFMRRFKKYTGKTPGQYRKED